MASRVLQQSLFSWDAMLKFALTIFTGAFLLFQVQPLIGKYILPWFGGTPAVWTTCMLFFQLLLLAGYAYAHFSTRRLTPRWQAAVHLALLLLAVALLPITPSNDWKPQDSSHPAWRIMTLLTLSIGLPYFVLSATGPLLQEWFRQTHSGRSPFRLYALSNLGSLLALVSYPFWFEIHFSRPAQAAYWSWGMGAFALLCGYCAIGVWRANAVGASAAEPESGDEGAPPGIGRYLLWLVLPACASVLLLATTNKLCQDVAVIPFLWVLPLGLYLLTFIISFDNPRWYSRLVFGVALVPVLVAVTAALFKGGGESIFRQVLVYCGALFVCGMVCHGELYRLRPAPRHLTAFYLMIGVGGALGGVFVAVVAPLLFNSYVELHWGVGLCAFLFLVVCARDREGLGAAGWCALVLIYGLAACLGLDRIAVWSASWLKANNAKLPWQFLTNLNWDHVQMLHWLVWLGLVLVLVRALFKGSLFRPRNWHLGACGLVTAGVAALVLALIWQANGDGRGAVSIVRNFYGVLSVWEYGKDTPDNHCLLLQHGRITHGIQFVDPVSAAWPTTYYGEKSGVGLALRHFPRKQDRAIGIVGLGTGTLAAYGQKGDRLRFYEINPEVQRLARSRFTYLKQCPARVEVVLGDARLSLERESAQRFDLLVLDAFSSDAIPVHLLTREAFEIYLRHMKPDGVVAVHISNHYLNLEPVVNNLAKHFRLQRVSISENGLDEEEEESGWWHYESTWVLLTRNEALLRHTAIADAQSKSDGQPLKIPLWTDDYTSLLPILE